MCLEEATNTNEIKTRTWTQGVFGVNYWIMKFSRTLLALSAVVLAGFLPGQAEAACTDPARPEADWRRCYFDERDFSGADLSGARLRDARFIRAKLSGANLTGVDAHRAKFISAVLDGIAFDKSRLTEVDFTKADLRNASFRGTDLRRARLNRADLRGADLTDAKLRGAHLLNANLSGATWIDGKTVCAEGSLGQCN